MTVFTWSATAADNDDADDTINCREGQAPSTLNDSMRAIMAAIAKWRDDMSGKVTTGGTATALTITTNQGYTSLTDGICVTAIMSVANGASPTLNVDGLGAKSLCGVSGSFIPTGALQQFSVQTFVYDQSADVWIAHAHGGAEFASGTAMVFYQASAPTGWTAESINNKALRVVSAGGTGGSDGGTTAFTSVFAARTITASNLPDHSITITDPGHTHDVTSCNTPTTHPTGSGRTDPTDTQTRTTTSATTGITAAFGTTARGGAQTAMDFAVQYCDVIIATKD